MTTKRPFGVTILALLAAIGAIIAIVHTLQMLHLFPIGGPFGQYKFFTFDLFGALLWGMLALIYIWVVRMLWNLDPQGWLFVVALATLNLIFAVVSIIGQSSWQAMLPAILVNGLILIYGLMPGTKAAFGMSSAEPEAADPAAAAERSVEVEAVQEEAAAVEEAVPAVEGEVDEVTEPEMEAEAEPVVDVEADLPAEADVEAVAAPQMEAEDRAAAMVTGAAAASHDLSYIEGIGTVYAGKLKEVGVDTPQTLLERGATPKGRNELANDTGISGHLILKWVNHVDLYRIKGLGAEYADLLEASGVDTVPELAQRNAANLHKKVIETNEEKHLVRHVPSLAQVEDWVSQAKQLPRVITY